MRLRVAAGQIPVRDDIAANAATILRAIDFAADEKADILLTPEGSLSGYRWEFDARQAKAALAEVTARAAANGVGLALGTCHFENDGRYYDQLRFYDRDGTFMGFHSKLLLCGTLEVPRMVK